MLLKDDFYYKLPKKLIAQHPPQIHGNSKLMLLDTNGNIAHKQITQLPQLLSKGDLLICNNSKVIAARLFGKKPSGGKVEIMVEKIIDEYTFLAQLKSSKPPKLKQEIDIASEIKLQIVGQESYFFVIESKNQTVHSVLEQEGHIPLPPYINRPDNPLDKKRYQPIMAKHAGSVAASTAALHFTDQILQTLSAQGVNYAEITLHIGSGTFAPIRTQQIAEHKIHTEWCDVSADVCEQIQTTMNHGGRVVAVGTSTLRALETAARSGKLAPYRGGTNLFIYDNDFPFKIVNMLLTNFHLPDSTLLPLVCAFAGRKRIQACYQEAIAQHYRFYSYGDAMLLYRKN